MSPRTAAACGPVNDSNDDTARRLRAIVQENLAFVWRALRGLGVAEGDVDDAAQKVFLVLSERLSAVAPGKERSFLFSTAMRVASHARRAVRRRHEIGDGPLEGLVDEAPSAEEALDRARARALLAEVIDGLPEDLRSVFVLYELERLEMAQIASLLEIPQGTVASRLRRAREIFQQRTLSMARRGRP